MCSVCTFFFSFGKLLTLACIMTVTLRQVMLIFQQHVGILKAQMHAFLKFFSKPENVRKLVIGSMPLPCIANSTVHAPLFHGISVLYSSYSLSSVTGTSLILVQESEVSESKFPFLDEAAF